MGGGAGAACITRVRRGLSATSVSAFSSCDPSGAAGSSTTPGELGRKNPPSISGKKTGCCRRCLPAPTASGPRVAARCAMSNPSPGTGTKSEVKAVAPALWRVPPALRVTRPADVPPGRKCVVVVPRAIRLPATALTAAGCAAYATALGAATTAWDAGIIARPCP